MSPRYFPIAVFIGCVMFSVLHAITYHIEQRAAVEAQQQPAPTNGGSEDPAASGSADGPTGRAYSTGTLQLTSVDPLKPVESSEPPLLKPISFHQGEVIANWNNKLIMQDTGGGRQVPMLTGLFYVYADQPGVAIESHGTVTMDLYDRTLRGPTSTPILMEEWHVDEATMKKLQRRDVNGICYVINLPWGAYRSDIRQVSLSTHYQPVAGNPMVDESNVISLDASAVQVPGDK